MAHPLLDYREQHGLSQEDLAERLSERLGREVKPSRVARLEKEKPKMLPKSYRDALGLDETNRPPDEALFAPDPPPGAHIPMRDPAATELPSLELQAGIAGRIQQAYGAIGAGVALISGNDGVSVVFDSYSPEISRAWVQAAEQNEHCRRIVEFMQSGGAVGELVVCHLLLLVGLLYVTGRGPDLGVLVGAKRGKLEPFRAGALERRAVQEAERAAAEQWEAGNASWGAGNGAAGAVGDDLLTGS